MSEYHPQLRQEQIDDFYRCYEYVNGQLAAYDRLLEQGHALSPEASEDIDDLLELQDYYKRMLDKGE